MASVEQQVVGEDAKIAAVSWTGGKDCNLALLKAWRNPSLRVTCLVVFMPLEARFRAHPLTLMEAQSKSLSLPLHRIVFPKDCDDYKKMYVAGIQSLKDEHGIEVIVTGDMDLVGTMKRNWIEECAGCVSVDTFLPLWKADRETVFKQVIQEKFVVIFSCVKSPYFDATWIGRSLDEISVEEMKTISLSRYDKVKPLDLCGENGEYHTMCFDGPLYQSRVEVKLGAPLELTEQRGQKDGETWWVLNVESSDD